MNCKYCGLSIKEEYPVCPVCGQWMISAPLALPAPKKSRSRLPYLLLLGMLLAGLFLFFLIPMDIPETTNSEETISENRLSPEGKTLLQKGCFLLEDGTLHFDESKFLASPILIVPAAIDQQPVEVIGSHCFENLQGVTTIILPSSITVIEDSAFAGCTQLRGVCIPNGTQTIGAEAFRGCKNLEAVYIPTGLDRIGTGAFDQCPKLSFLFYNGLYDEWLSLYPEVITPFTWVICWDGEYRHSAKTP